MPARKRTEIDSTKAREDSVAALRLNKADELPTEISTSVSPPRSLVRTLEGRQGAMCGQAFSLTWDGGPQKGLPVTGYCVEPLCINEGHCTGPRFIPHVDQWTSDDPNNRFRQRRKLDKIEVLAAVKAFTARAEQETHTPDTRSDREILAYVKMVWMKILTSIRGQGEWKR